MLPSIGRIVHYCSYGTPNGEYLSAPRAAIVTAVHTPVPGDGEETISLCILNPTGMFFTSGLKYSETPKPGCWSWPPKV